jgi:hypothetical protein
VPVILFLSREYSSRSAILNYLFLFVPSLDYQDEGKEDRKEERR